MDIMNVIEQVILWKLSLLLFLCIINMQIV